MWECTAQDIEGWKKLQEVLGERCLLVADRTLDKLSEAVNKDHGGERDEGGDEAEVEVETERGKDSQMEGREHEEGASGLEGLSCARLSLGKTLLDTCFQAHSLRG